MNLLKNIVVIFMAMIISFWGALMIREHVTVDETYGVAEKMDPDVINLIGSGDVRLGEIQNYASSTTLFQFASSSDELWWDTKKSNWPQYYGATPTAAFLTEHADSVKFNFTWHVPTDHAAGHLTCEFAQSDSAGCEQASSTLNTANWRPLPIHATDTEAFTFSGPSGNASSTFTYTPGAAGDYEWSIQFDNFNARCAQIKCYNGSTTDDSTLWTSARLE